ncbi:MAG: DUF2469 family protein [Actinomycetota bacterium]
MSAEDLERFEAESELALFQEYRDVIKMFRYVVDTDRRTYLANTVEKLGQTEDGAVEYRLTDAWVWDVYRQSRFLTKVTIATSRGIVIEELPEREL